mmetsp:Transcript_23217/g.32467  ORF Transcript_23217/g.32467 Transcript_23217/m.32467 type:complete len:89 (+) Transcript_23217:303-569(+)
MTGGNCGFHEILGLQEPPPDPSKDEILEACRMQAMLYWNPSNYNYLTAFEKQELTERFALIRLAERSLISNYLRKKNSKTGDAASGKH